MAEIDLLAVTKDVVADGQLDDQDVKDILAAARERNKTRTVTQKETAQVMHIVRDRIKDATFDKVPLGIKVLSVLLIIVGIAALFNGITLILAAFSAGLHGNALKEPTPSSTAILVAGVILAMVASGLSVAIGFRMLKGRRGSASVLINANMAITVASAVCQVMLFGVGLLMVFSIAHLVAQIALASYLSPSLIREANLRVALRRLDTEVHAKDGTLGLADPGEGFIRLDFFNVFWTFVVCCFLGLVVEVIWHMVVVDPGVYQDRAGLLFGPFSPIYGVGATLMTIALNRFKDKNILFLFVMCTIIGGGFEYFTSWFMEVSFGAVAWDYHGKFLGDLFGGRTCLLFASMFGVLGVVWVKLLLPLLLKLINMIPWKMRYGVTVVCAVLMMANCLMTLQALDNWSARTAGHEPATPVERFYAENFDNDWMAQRFESMTLTPENSVRKHV